MTTLDQYCESVHRADGFLRFNRVPSFAAWIRLVPRTFERQALMRDGIAMANIKHLRKLLVKAAWCY